jgi:hypothetical protein
MQPAALESDYSAAVHLTFWLVKSIAMAAYIQRCFTVSLHLLLGKSPEVTTKSVVPVTRHSAGNGVKT